MRVTSPRIPRASSAASRVLRESSRLSPASSAVPEALSDAALSDAALLAGAGCSKLSWVPGVWLTGSPP